MKIVSAEKKLVAPLIEECAKTVEEVKLAKITHVENENSYKCSSCAVYKTHRICYFVNALPCYFGYFLQLMLA